MEPRAERPGLGHAVAYDAGNTAREPRRRRDRPLRIALAAPVPRVAIRAVHRVRTPARGAELVAREHDAVLAHDDAHACTLGRGAHARVAAPCVRARGLAQVERIGAGLGDEACDLLGGSSPSQHEPRAAGREAGAEVPKTVEQEAHARGAAPGAREQAVVEHEHRHELVRRRCSGGEERVIVHPKVVPQPDDRPHQASSLRRSAPAALSSSADPADAAQEEREALRIAER